MRKLYASSNGDRWDLVVDASSGYTFVRHTANEPSGGNVADIALPIFLSLDAGGPEHQALWALIRRSLSEGTKPVRRNTRQAQRALPCLVPSGLRPATAVLREHGHAPR